MKQIKFNAQNRHENNKDDESISLDKKVKNTTAEQHLIHLLNIGWKKDSIIIRKFCQDWDLDINEFTITNRKV